MSAYSHFLKIASVSLETSRSRSWIYREVKAGNFPAPLKIGASSVWDANAIEEWKSAIRSGRPWNPANATSTPAEKQGAK